MVRASSYGEVLRHRLPQVKLDVSGRIAVEPSKHLIAEPLIEWPGLEAVGFDRRADGAARARVTLRIVHKPRPVSGAARCFSDPQMGHLQQPPQSWPSSPPSTSPRSARRTKLIGNSSASR